MVEIYAGNMSRFFENSGIHGVRTYYNEDKHGVVREVWEISEEDLDKMSDMSEEEFAEIAGDDAWWRYATGSNMSEPWGKFVINGHRVKGWFAKGEYGGVNRRDHYDTLLDYFCNNIGVSQPRNVCALAVDMAKYNGMTMGELFTLLQP